MIKKEKKEKEQKINIPDVQSERMLVSKCLTEPEYAALVFDRFDKRWFENKNLAAALEICIAYYKKYVTLPTRKTLDAILDKMVEVKKIEDSTSIKRELDTLTDVCNGIEDKFVKDSIVDFIKSKAGYYTILDNLEDIRENKDVSKCISSFQNIAEITFDINLGFNYFEEFSSKHEQEICNPLSRLSLGYDSFDKLTHGGIYANGRCLFVMMGQPGIGKSLFLSNFAVNFLKQNKRVLIFSLEMSEHIYGTRVDAHLSGEDINELQFKFDRVKEKVMDFKELYPGSSLFIKEYPPNTITCNHLINFTNKLIKSKGKPDVILVDYINLLNPATNRFGGSENTYTAVGTVAKELRAMSYIFECPVISVTQVNRCIQLDAKVIIKENNIEKEINIVNIKEGDLIKSNNGFNIVTKRYEPTKQKLYRIKTKSGLILKCSKKHIFPCIKDGKNIEIGIKDGLTVGDKLFVNIINNTNN